MFRQLAATSTPDIVLTGYRPSQLAEFLESLWNSARLPPRQLALGPNLGLFHEDMARADSLDPLAAVPPDPGLQPPTAWHHIAYAYMLENTRMVEIFRRVVFEWLTGERLPIPTQPTQRWLQVTEQLFFGSPWAYSVRSITSSLRPDSGAVRRNAYYRLLGMDLNHGADDGHAYPYVKPEVANREFATVFEALLYEVWRAYANRFTAVSENLTDDEAIRTLLRRIREMLQTRREAGMLSREEFESVALASWLHLTIETDTAVVVDLSARASGVADRLIRIGERVGLPAHARSDSYVQLAVPMSTVLIGIESTLAHVAADYYMPGGVYTNDMLQIITHWSVATGRNIKDPTYRQPIASVLRQLAPSNVSVVAPAPVSAPAWSYGSNGTGGPNGSGAPTGGRLGALLG